jgi:tripartite-type tricarboxylate transporter receptor subunit TctC
MPAAGDHSEKLTTFSSRPRALALRFVVRRSLKLPHRRKFLHLAAGAVALPMVSRIATAQAYPSRPVRIVAGFPPGGVNDLHARLFGQWLSERLHQQFVVENRPGAGGSLAADSVARSQPDGYTLLLTSASDSWNTALYDNLKFDYLRDLVPVASLTRFTGVLVVHPSHPAQTVPELIAGIKRNPGKVSMATAGVGSASHIYWELFKSITGVDMVHVPYRGEGPALVDLIAGQIPMMIPSLPPSIEYIKAGRLRPLAVTVASRDEALSEIPTMNSFLPAYEANAWVGT